MSLQLPGIRTATSSPPLWSDPRPHSLTSSSPPISSSARAASPFAPPSSSSSSVASFSTHSLAPVQSNSSVPTIPTIPPLSPFDTSIHPPPPQQLPPKREHGDYRLQLWVGNVSISRSRFSFLFVCLLYNGINNLLYYYLLLSLQLPFRVRWQDLKDLFRKCGTVLRADVALTLDKYANLSTPLIYMSVNLRKI